MSPGVRKSTAVSFPMSGEEFDAEVAHLRNTGVEFRTFETEDATWDDGVATFSQAARAAWFADPDGTILETGA